MSFCNLIGDERGFAGRQVVVHALLAQTPHGREIYSPACKGSAELWGSSELWDKRAKAVIDAALANNELARVPVVVSGVFQSSTRYENGVRVIIAGGPFIKDARIVAARQP
jgi:hypothetical protein